MRLRDVELGDVGAYVRMRCDPVMMAELGGPQPREGMAAKVARDVQQAASDAAWIKMIIPDTVVTNVPSNGVCRSAGFRFVEERETTFAGRVFRTNHWAINPATDLTVATAPLSSG
jgi:RimJ/RimL family protein N-acetyltransferase